MIIEVRIIGSRPAPVSNGFLCLFGAMCVCVFGVRFSRKSGRADYDKEEHDGDPFGIMYRVKRTRLH